MKETKFYRIAFFYYGHNLAETTRAIEVALKLKQKGVEIEFFSHGGPHTNRPTEVGFKNSILFPEITPKQHERFLDLDQGRERGELFTPDEWINFAKSELDVLSSFKPDAIYAGFNLVSVISSRIAKIPLIFLIPTQGIKTYYEYKMGVFPEFLENGFTRIIPASWKNAIFNKVMTSFNYLPITNVNKAIKYFKGEPLVSSFEMIRGDLVLLSDLEEITGLPASSLPPNHHYTGPLFANLPIEIPPEVKKVFQGPEYKIFCAMGSSGSADILRTAILTLKKTNYRIVAATTSIMDPKEFEPFSDRFYVTRYVPATPVNEMADLAITHGGQGTLQNSIWAGKPLIGVPFQFEQQTNLDMIERAGIGIKIPMYRYSEEVLLKEIERIKNNPEFLNKAINLSKKFRMSNGAQNAAEIIFDFLNTIRNK